MDYTEQFLELKARFTSHLGETIHCSSSNVFIKNFLFQSSFSIDFANNSFGQDDNYFFDPKHIGSLNSRFTYPIVIPGQSERMNKAIIMLHGLNERSWDKYLPWAHDLAEITGKPVILFPIAYHINRSPEEWIKRQHMSPYVQERLNRIPVDKELSFINVALSERLSIQPQRFFLSGYQAANDIIQLVDEIRNGVHPLFEKDTQIDFFSYSIGVLLSEVLLIADQENRFTRSKFFFFCGGSVFEGMHGISKYIIDSNAFNRINEYYLNGHNNEQKSNSLVFDLLHHSVLGRAYQNMLSYKELRKLSSRLKKRLRKQVKVICLKKDKVIPTISVRRTLKTSTIEELDFEYEYTHESPFPIIAGAKSALVDRAFNLFIHKAGLYLV